MALVALLLSFLPMHRTSTWTSVHLSPRLCVTVETHRCYTPGKTLSDFLWYVNVLILVIFWHIYISCLSGEILCFSLNSLTYN